MEKSQESAAGCIWHSSWPCVVFLESDVEVLHSFTMATMATPPTVSSDRSHLPTHRSTRDRTRPSPVVGRSGPVRRRAPVSNPRPGTGSVSRVFCTCREFLGFGGLNWAEPGWCLKHSKGNMQRGRRSSRNGSCHVLFRLRVEVVVRVSGLSWLGDEPDPSSQT